MMKTILVVDDKAGVRNLVRDYLEVENFCAVFAADGRETLYAAAAKSPT
jgi:CheY-like chemotaxis protein